MPGANFYNSRLNENDDTVTLRTFSSSNKGSWGERKGAFSIANRPTQSTGIVNRGDSFRRRRSRSSSLIPPTSPMKAPEETIPSGPSDSYLVAMLGSAGVGKCALLSQFRTSECINAYETGRGKYHDVSSIIPANCFPSSNSSDERRRQSFRLPRVANNRQNPNESLHQQNILSNYFLSIQLQELRRNYLN